MPTAQWSYWKKEAAPSVSLHLPDRHCSFGFAVVVVIMKCFNWCYLAPLVWAQERYHAELRSREYQERPAPHKKPMVLFFEEVFEVMLAVTELALLPVLLLMWPEGAEEEWQIVFSDPQRSARDMCAQGGGNVAWIYSSSGCTWKRLQIYDTCETCRPLHHSPPPSSELDFPKTLFPSVFFFGLHGASFIECLSCSYLIIEWCATANAVAESYELLAMQSSWTIHYGVESRRQSLRILFLAKGWMGWAPLFFVPISVTRICTIKWKCTFIKKSLSNGRYCTSICPNTAFPCMDVSIDCAEIFKCLWIWPLSFTPRM